MKKIVTLCLLLMALFFKSDAQESNLSAGIIGSVNGNLYKYDATSFVHDYSYSVGYSYGLGLKYSTKGKLFFHSGIKVFSDGYQVNYNFIAMDPDDPAIPKESNLSFSYVMVPVQVGMHVFERGRFAINPSIGLNTSFRMYHDEYTIYADNAKRASTQLSDEQPKVLLGLTAGLGFEMELTKKVSLHFIPCMHQGLIGIYENFVDTGQLSAGVVLGLYYTW